MLLQIEEPGQNSNQDNFTSPAIGIDLGTTNSVASIVKNGSPKTILLKGKKLLPSIISYDDKTWTVGEETMSGKVLRSTKRLFDNPEKPIENLQENPVTVAARILQTIKEESEKELGHPIENAVITVPAHFDEPARQATKKAAAMAGLKVLRLINEPTAAAVAYHLEHKNEGIYAIYDLGGGTFDFSLLRLQGGVFQVLAVGGDTKLGGDDIDQAIVAHFKDQNKTIDHQTAKWMKEELSNSPVSQRGELELRQDELKQITETMIEKTLLICAKTLREGKVKVSDVQGVVLVGGSTRLLGVREKVGSFFGKAALDNINPDEVVAHGAALQAHALAYGSDHLLLDVTPLSLGIETLGGIVEKIIPRNTPLPCHMAQDFTNYVDGQTMMDIHIVQGEREMAKDCRSLGRFILKNIPPLKAHQARIRVEFMMDVDGLLTVSAKELTTGMAQHIEVKPQHNLEQQDMEKMILEGMHHSVEDMEERMLHYAKNEASQILLEIEKTLADLDENLGDQPDLEQAVNQLKQSLESDNRDNIKAALSRLTALAEPLAQRRIQKAIEETL